MSEEQQGSLFSEDEIEVLETEESKLKKLANEIFRSWYVQWYKDAEGRPRYTQSESYIASEIKKAVLHGIDPYQLEWAANILGQEGKPINALNFQWSLVRVQNVMRREGSLNTNYSQDKKYKEGF